MKDIKVQRGYYLIHKLIDEGEHETQDFKFAISDARKIARSISAFANRRGGSLLIGVKDNGAVAGVRSEEDIYVVEQAAQMYCEPPQEVGFQAYRVEDGLTVIRATVAAASERPVSVREGDGRLRAYYRVADENIAAHPLMVRAWRMQASHAPELGTISLDGPVAQIVRAVTEAADTQPLTPERVALQLHLSQATANAHIATLLALGILDFAFTPTAHTFILVPPTQN